MHAFFQAFLRGRYRQLWRRSELLSNTGLEHRSTAILRVPSPGAFRRSEGERQDLLRLFLATISAMHRNPGMCGLFQTWGQSNFCSLTI